MATNIRQLILARGFQGFGAALLVPGSLAIISNSFSEEQRGPAIGTWSGLSAMATALGPVLGGWLIEQVSWRAVFFINLPLALIVILISQRHVRETSDRQSGGIDLLGASVIALALGALVYGLIESSRLGLVDPFIITMLIAAAALFLLFVLIEARLSNPMLPLTLFRSPQFTGANLLTFFLYAALGGTLFFLPLNLIQVQHYSATTAGAALLPFILVISLISRWSGGLTQRYGSQLPLIVGPLIVALGYLLFALPGIDGSYWRYFFPPIVLLGLGMAITIPPLTTMVMNSVPQDRAGLASGVNNTVARTGGLIAVAVLGIVMLRVFSRDVDRRLIEWNVPVSAAEWLQTQHIKLAAITPPQEMTPDTSQLIHRVVNESFVSGFRVIMLVGAGLAGVSAITSVFCIRKTSSEQTAK